MSILSSSSLQVTVTLHIFPLCRRRHQSGLELCCRDTHHLVTVAPDERENVVTHFLPNRSNSALLSFAVLPFGSGDLHRAAEGDREVPAQDHT